MRPVRISVMAPLRGDELEPVDVDEAAVGDLQRRDHREREEGERQERGRARPAELVRRPRSWRGSARSPSRAARPRGGRRRAAGTRPRPAPSSTTTMPPPIAARWLTASARSSSLMPTTTRLWASWATDEASAPRLRPEPADEAEPDPAGGEVPLDDGDLGEVGIGVGDGVAVDDDRLAHRATPSRPGPRSGRSRGSWRRPSGISKSAAVTGFTRTVWRTHSGTGGDGTSLDRPAAP